MAKKKSKLAELGLDKKTLDRIYVQAKIKATPYDYSLKDRIVLETPDKYEKTVNVFYQDNDTENKILNRLNVGALAAEKLKYAAFGIGPDKRTYDFPKLNWPNHNVHLVLRILMLTASGYMYKHNNMVINEMAFTRVAETYGVKAAEALIGLYARLYANDSIIPQLTLTLWESTRGLSLDDVANLTFVREAMEAGEGYVPDTGIDSLLGQTLSQMFYIGAMRLDDHSHGLYPGHAEFSHIYSELLRQNVIESAMYMCEIYRAFNSMDPDARDALAPLLTQDGPSTLIGVTYDINEAKFTSPDFDAFCDEPADSRFEKIQTYALAQLSANLPDALTWDGTNAVNHAMRLEGPTFRICNDLHCKAWEDFRVRNFALMLQMCQEKGIDINDLRTSVDGGEASGGGGGGGNADQDDQDFGNMRMGTKYTPSEQVDSGNPGEKAQRNTTPQLETMSNLLKSCDTKYAIDVKTIPNNKGYKDAYLKLLKPIEFITKELTKQIRAIKTYNFGGKNAGKSRGKLDSHTMYRYKTDPNVFYDTTYKVREMDLAFGVILDQSGSMCGDGIHNGMISLIMLHHVLTSLRINHAIVGHNSYNFNNVSIMKYVAFNEDAAHTMEVPYMLANLHSSGGNCDSGALNYMEQYIKRTRNKDKIVLIFSDGEPSECEESDLHKQVRKMEREGIHVIGLGIDFENIKHYYPDHANGRTLSEMVNILVGILKRYVLDKKS